MVEFGVGLATDDVRTLGERAKRAEATGFSRIGIGDSQSVLHEVYVCLTAVALSTSTVRLGPTVSNPVTRHPAVTAAAIATLDEISGGRAFLGLGTGDSALYYLGYQPVSRAALRRYVDAVRRLMLGEEVEWQGGTGHISWISRPVPILLAAEGPRVLELAGEIADGAIVHTGLSPEQVKDSFQRVEAHARAAGRDPAALDLSVFAKCSLDDDPVQALRYMRVDLGISAHHAFRDGVEGRDVPPGLQEAVKQFIREYDPAEHDQSDDNPNAVLPEKLGLTNFLGERFAIAGTPDRCRERIEELVAAGVNRFTITARGRDQETVIERFGREIISRIG